MDILQDLLTKGLKKKIIVNCIPKTHYIYFLLIVSEFPE